MMRRFFLGRSIRFSIVYLLLLSFLRVGFAADSNAKNLAPLEDKIGQAKILYYDFQFKQSEQLLQDVIANLMLLDSSTAVNSSLSDAYLLMALTQNAQDKDKAMQNSLYQAVSYSPDRTLTKGQYSPKIISQFEKAKQKYLLAQNQVPTSLSAKASDLNSSSTAFASKSGKNPSKKPFYKTWPFFVILGIVVAGGAAGAAIALGGGGSGGGGPTGPTTVGGTPQ